MMKALTYTIINFLLFLLLFAKEEFVNGPTFIVYGGLAIAFNFIALLLGLLINYVNRKLNSNYISKYIIFSIAMFVLSELLWSSIFHGSVLFGFFGTMNDSDLEKQTKLLISGVSLVSIGITGVTWFTINWFKKNKNRNAYHY